MPIDDILAEKADVEAMRQQRQAGQRRAQMAAQGTVSRASLGPVVQFEKTDIQMWMDVATVVLLAYIALKV